MKSITQVSQKDILEKWYQIDARGMKIGRLASIISEILQGKNNPLMRENLKPMNKVVVINAEKLDIPEKKSITKFYKFYSGFPGGLRYLNLRDQYKKDPTYVIEKSVKGMLPKTKRGREMIANLRIYVGENHNHQAQNPEVLNIRSLKI